MTWQQQNLTSNQKSFQAIYLYYNYTLDLKYIYSEASAHVLLTLRWTWNPTGMIAF